MLFYAKFEKGILFMEILSCHRFSRIWDVNDKNEMERKWHWKIFDVGCLMAFEWNV